LANIIRKMNEEIGREMIILAGFVEDTPSVMNQADIVIGVGVVVAEAMACGRPVIVARTQFGGIVDEHNVAELRRYNFTGRNSTTPTDAQNLFVSINALLGDERYMKRLGEFGRRYAEEEFEPNKIASQVELVYKRAQENVKNPSRFTLPFLVGWKILPAMLYIFVKEVFMLKISKVITFLSKPFAR